MDVTDVLAVTCAAAILLGAASTARMVWLAEQLRRERVESWRWEREYRRAARRHRVLGGLAHDVAAEAERVGRFAADAADRRVYDLLAAVGGTGARAECLRDILGDPGENGGGGDRGGST